MTDTDITPEIVESVADWVFETGIDASVVHVLREAAAVMRHEQADEKRIDALAAVAYEAAQKHLQSTFNEWGRASDSAVGLYRAIVRAVVAKLEQDDLITDPLEAAEHQEKVLGITQEQCAAEAKGETFLASYGVAPRPQSGYGDPADEWDRKPRLWNDLRDVPMDVLTVRCPTSPYSSDRIFRNGSTPFGWLWGNGMNLVESSLIAFAPYVEIVDLEP